MIDRAGLAYSKALILRAHKRLRYQQDVVAKLGSHSEPRYADTARDVLSMMQAKLNALIQKHRNFAGRETRV